MSETHEIDVSITPSLTHNLRFARTLSLTQHPALSMRYTIEGNLSGKTVVFIHGWPDGPQLFEPMVATLRSRYRCVRCTFSGFDPLDRVPFWGVPLGEVATELKEIIEAVMQSRKEGEGNNAPALVAHDWGCVAAYELIHRDPFIVSALVALDVGGHIGKLTAFGSLCISAYQGVLIVLYFMVPSFLATLFTTLTAFLLGAPSPWDARRQMNYPYFQLWRSLLTGTRLPSMKGFVKPKMPTLFLYGANKPFQFHSQAWVDYLNGIPNCRAVGISGGHWFFVKAAKVESNDLIANFLQSTLQ